MDRRTALGRLTVALGGLAGAMVGLPVLGPLLDPILRRRGEGSGEAPYLDAGPVDRFAEGVITPAVLVDRPRDGWVRMPEQAALGIFVRKEAEGAFAVWSRVCPHLGCAVLKAPAAGGFECPCHGSAFDSSGRRIEAAGHTNPSPRDLDRLPSRVVEERLQVQLLRFHPGRPTPERIADSAPPCGLA